MRSASPVVALAFCLSQQTPPVFRAGVDVVEMNVSVWDKDRKPVRGLKAEDFTVLEDGKPQKIVAFSEVYTPPPAAPSAPWIRDVAPDVEANDVKDKELFVIVLDDANLTGSPKYIPISEVNVSKTVAKAAIERLQPGDVAAIIFSNDSAKGQSFTSDRSKLLRAIDTLTVGPNYNGVPSKGGAGSNSRTTQAEYDCRPMWLATDALRSAVEALSGVPHRRTSVLFISVGPDTPILGTVEPGEPRLQCVAKAQGNTLEVLKMAQRANVNVYTVDPSGLSPPWVPGGDSVKYLVGMAENTGGRAIVDTNDEVGHLAAVMDDMRAYYLLGYELTDRKSDGRFHRVEVKVNRPGVEVHSRSTRYDPLPDKPSADATATPSESAVGGFLPKDDLRVEAAVAPFVTGAQATTVQVALTVRAPVASPLGPRDQADLLIRAFTPDGRAMGTTHETVPVVVDAGSTFEVASRIDLKPGRYSLRIAVTSKTAGRTGSVYTDVVVPDFAKDPLSLSGVVMTESAGSSLRGDALAALTPTTTRVLDQSDRMQAFLRVYQGGTAAISPVAVKVRIVDEKNTAVVDRTDTLPATVFSSGRQADYSYRLPLSTLKAGQYWLSIQAAIGKQSVRRDVRFSVR
jgi:VWFA-related protein